MNEPGNLITASEVAAPVLSQAMPAPAESDAVTVPTPADAPMVLFQLSSAGWSEAIPFRLR